MHSAIDDPSRATCSWPRTSISARELHSSAADLKLGFVVPQKPDDKTTVSLASARTRLLIIVDDAPRVELYASIGQTMDRERCRLAAGGPEVAQSQE